MKTGTMWKVVILLVALAPGFAWADRVMEVVHEDSNAQNLLFNANFEETSKNQVTGWNPYQNGYQYRSSGGQMGGGIVCQSTVANQGYGASQKVEMNREYFAPLIVRGWSKSENVSGNPDSGYSIYVDIEYQDGTPLYGQTANFPCGTHGWIQRQIMIYPSKPVRSLTVYALFRGHSGTAWFDDFALYEVRPQGENLFQFHGLALKPGPLSKFSGSSVNYRTEDGLNLIVDDHRVKVANIKGYDISTYRDNQRNQGTGKKTANSVLPREVPAGFYVRDAATESDIYNFKNGKCTELGLSLDCKIIPNSNRLVLEGQIVDLWKTNRAITLFFGLPCQAIGWQWGDDIRTERTIQPGNEYSQTVRIGCGSTQTLSTYPWASIHNDRVGLAMAMDLNAPSVCRLFYQSDIRQLCIAYEFGLSADSQRFPSSASFRFLIYQFEPTWGFRSAYQKFSTMYPELFQTRIRNQGIWMPFTDISTVEGWQDFGFRFHEGNGQLAFDDANDILSFRYTEPMTWWMPMAKEMPRNYVTAISIRDQLSKKTGTRHQLMSDISKVAAMKDAEGNPHLLFRNEPWCDGAVWSLNPNPYLPGVPVSQDKKASETRTKTEYINAATIYWNDSMRQSLYGPKSQGNLDGEYLDSLEGYVTAEMNFDTNHFRYSILPLTYDPNSKLPVIFKGMAIYEFTQWFSTEVRDIGKLMFANGVPYRFSFLCPLFDVMGTETDWLNRGRYSPAPQSQMNLWRTMSGQKPYVILMNTDYNQLVPELVEKYFQQCLFYGFWPSMFSHNASENPYWKNPKWYNRDRPLFKKYIPLIKTVAEAGWQPITGARCDNPSIQIERFGDRVLYFTLFNPTAETQQGSFTLDYQDQSLERVKNCIELKTGEVLPPTNKIIKLTLEAKETKVLKVIW